MLNFGADGEPAGGAAGIEDEIYAAALTAGRWPRVLQQLAERTGSTGGLLFSGRGADMRWTATGAVSDLMHAYLAEGWAAQDDRLLRVKAAAPRGFISDAQLYQPGEMERVPQYRDFLHPRGFGWCAGMLMTGPGEDAIVLSLERRREQGPMPAEAMAELARLQPDLARAAFIASRLQGERAHSAVQVLAVMGLPAGALTGGGRLLLANELLQELVGQVLFDQRDRLKFPFPAADAAFEAQLATGQRRSQARAGSFAMPIMGERKACLVHLLPVTGAAQDMFAAAEWLLVLVPVAMPRGVPGYLLETLFALTPAEARVASGLLDGQSVEDLASAARLSRETIRAQLKAVMHKTGTRRQADLVNLLASARGIRLPQR